MIDVNDDTCRNDKRGLGLRSNARSQRFWNHFIFVVYQMLTRTNDARERCGTHLR